MPVHGQTSSSHFRTKLSGVIYMQFLGHQQREIVPSSHAAGRVPALRARAHAGQPRPAPADHARKNMRAVPVIEHPPDYHVLFDIYSERSVLVRTRPPALVSAQVEQRQRAHTAAVSRDFQIY